MVVGEAPGENEVLTGRPFMGASGYELDRMLGEAGLNRGLCFVTNVARERPVGNDIEQWWMPVIKKDIDYTVHKPFFGRHVADQIRFGFSLLQAEVAQADPVVIIALGNVALWALTGEWGVRKWRGSILVTRPEFGPPRKVIPTYHPAAVLREYPLRSTAIHDLRRVKVELELGREIVRPETSFITRPTIGQVRETLLDLWARLERAKEPLKLAPDIETRAGHIACLGIAWNRRDAICIPFMCVEREEGYWSLDEEMEVWRLLRRVLTHPRAFLVGQNWAYDQQYIWRWFWYLPPLGRDTMLTHHAMFSHSPKGLDFLASIYNDHHLYWKDDGKTWDAATGEDQLWVYNCQDCVNTFEVEEHEAQALSAFSESWPKLPEVESFQTRTARAVVRMMLRGMRTDEGARRTIGRELDARLALLQTEVNHICAHPVNINSPKQVQAVFYEELALTPVKKRNSHGGWSPTTDDDALDKIALREPALGPLCRRIQAMRSLDKFNSTFVEMRRDTDGRLRCSYNVAGTVTYRFSSSTNAFGSGGNLQNIPSGDEEEDAEVQLPNIRKLFLFDPDRIGFDLDGDSADLRIVTGESGCRQMQAYFAAGVKPYVEIAKEFYHDQSITKHHRSYKVMKALCHATNYYGTPAGLSVRIGLPVKDVERMQKWYFGMCPEIKAWQEDVIKQIDDRGWIENPFGYRCWFVDRKSQKDYRDGMAWIPQSSVGIFINRILVSLDEAAESGALPVELLLQVHDSLTGQWPSSLGMGPVDEIKSRSRVPIQCRSGEIVIPVGLKTSTTSWGDCK